ncbi:hypothetical protein [Streptomyces resistomycificus]|uniref:Uncharacterized protein n=1 Tax=Streptomyces resistomycificus TaxID=67356 RepID=A0A0L8L8Q9_9ACTN|nr:hypothetical protein [Streptomyces resistomycificus]KOG34504.1 hypothetical protein ADK37_18410 [Streptomyces resistomycificus]KUO00713.1 hypothetical protein AQJ84_06860 [Streptomyces resistomycificus]
MADQPKVHVGKVVNAARGSVRAMDGFAALNQIVEAARECIHIHEVESTKRARLETYEATEVARIRAAESVLKDYFTQAFAERRTVFEEMFTRLDRALDEGNGEVLHTVVRGIVDIAKTSPLADVGDLSQIRAALDDPDQVWEL